jgi:uroporphyrinogen decarboxylase
MLVPFARKHLKGSAMPFPLTDTEINIIKAVRFDRPDYIPARACFNGSCWDAYPHDAIGEWMESHPMLFPSYDPSTGPARPTSHPYQQVGQPYTDPWGCVWESSIEGITGTVVKHPLESWDAFDSWTPPDPRKSNGKTFYETDESELRNPTFSAGLDHGHTFLRLCDLRGYVNLLMDMADDEKRLWNLIEIVEGFNLHLVQNALSREAQWIGYPEDLGMQVGPMLSPDQFRKWIKPSYQRLIAPARKAGCIIHMHSDGDIRTLAEDLIEGGVEVLNLQDLVNGIDWIAKTYGGRVAIDLDIDRQSITVNGTPQQIDDHIRHAVETIGRPEGGLMMFHGIYPGTPHNNITAVLDAMERYATFYN